MMYNMAASILRSYGDSRTPLYFLILASLTNIVLDYVFLKTLRMGVGGAAIATLISQALSVVLCVLYIKEKTSFLIPGKEDFHWDKEMLKAQLSLGISMGLMNSIVSIGSVILQSAVNKLGSVIIAGHTASRKVIESSCSRSSASALPRRRMFHRIWERGSSTGFVKDCIAAQRSVLCGRRSAS